MGLASNQARLNVLTLRKADLEARLLTLSNQTQRIARHGHSYPRGIQSKEARTPLKTSIT